MLLLSILLAFYSAPFLNITSPGDEEKGKTTLHRPMSFGFWFANISSDLRLLLLDGHVCKVRHFGLSFRRRDFLTSRVQYYPNSDSRFQLTRVTVSGDIELNPGPTSCSVCNKVIASNHRALSCDQCKLWCHMECGQVKLSEYKRLQQMDQFNWICPACLLTASPFADASVLSGEGECCAQTLNASNLLNTSASSPVPEFNKSRNDDDREILIMHLNIIGIQNKFEEVKQLMKNSKHKSSSLQKQKLTQPTLLLSLNQWL